MMKGFFKVLALFVVAIFFIPHDSFAQSYAPKIANDVGAKVTINNKKLTNNPISFTIDTSNYNHGNNYLYNTLSETLFMKNKITMTVTKNGDYPFIVVDKSSNLDKDSFFINAKFVQVSIHNIDREKPTSTC